MTSLIASTITLDSTWAMLYTWFLLGPKTREIWANRCGFTTEADLPTIRICTLSNFYNTPAAGLLTIHRGMLFQLRYSTSNCRNNVAADFLAVVQQLQ